MFSTIRAFLYGMYDFRTPYYYTWSYAVDSEQLAYDHGRELMHKITFHAFDPD